MRRRGNLVIGGLLVVLGALFLLGNVFRLNVGGMVAAFFVMIPGVLFFVGMAAGGKAAGPLAIPGSILTMTGLILLGQALLYLFDASAYASWAYAWALVFPTSVGVGLIVFGSWSQEPKVVRTGLIWTGVGLAIFALAGAFFELLLNLTDNPVTDFMWPALLIALGVYLLRRPRRGTPPPGPDGHKIAEEASPQMRAPKMQVEFEPLDKARAKKAGKKEG
jgi:hypothetical protein